MNIQEQNNKLSIVIPTFNGDKFLAETLNSILGQSMSEFIEVVVCDDRSSDRTKETAANFCSRHGNIKLFENSENLGMDGNFDQAASHATGEYIWFCGQDDIIGEGAIEKVLTVLKTDPSIDFLYMNFGQFTQDFKKVLTEKMLPIDSDVRCHGAQPLFDTVGILLPTFLPAFVLRRKLWNKVDKKLFYGTQFVQIGVFLAVLKDLHSYIVAHPFVKGRIPDAGWQQNRLKVLDIFTGFLEIITYYYKRDPEFITEQLYKKHRWFCFKNAAYNMYILRVEGIPLSNKVATRLPKIFSGGQLLIINFFLNMPRSIAALLNPVANALVGRYKKTHDYKGNRI